MTRPVGHSIAPPGTRKRHMIEQAQRMVWQARFIGWRALEASWQQTLKKLEKQ